MGSVKKEGRRCREKGNRVLHKSFYGYDKRDIKLT